jgi:hypothetical protein
LLPPAFVIEDVVRRQVAVDAVVRQGDLDVAERELAGPDAMEEVAEDAALAAIRGHLGGTRGLRRLGVLPGELEEAIAGKSDSELSRRPQPDSWGAKEIVCHLRDVEELFQIRFHTVVALDEPRILVLGASATDLAPWRIGGAIGHPLDPARWAAERQYLRNDTHEALAAFQGRRTEVLALLRSLSPAEWERGGIHLSQGRLTLGDWVARLAAHDDNHLDQLRRALEGRA